MQWITGGHGFAKAIGALSVRRTAIRIPHKKTFGERYGGRRKNAAARAELLSPSESTNVTSAALANGFFHLARFSAYYRAAFDETPVQTLRRSRARRTHRSLSASV